MKIILKKIYHLIPLKKQIYSILNKFSIPRSIYQHLTFKDWIFVNIDNNLGFYMYHYGFFIENELFWNGLYGKWEKNSLRLWSSLAKKSNVILDIGANTGVYSLLAATINPKAEIYAFEPVKRVYDKLLFNVDKNQLKNIHCFNYAISNKTGEAVIYDTMSEHIYSVTVNMNLNPKLETSKQKIYTKRLDEFISENNLKNIDLIKIDVETHECEVLESLGNYLSKFKPDILIEILNDDIAKRIHQIIKELDYFYFNINEDNGVLPTNTLTKSDSFNYLLCTHKSKLYLEI